MLMSGVTTLVFPRAAPQHASAESNQENWEMIGRHQVHSKQLLGVSFTGECILIFHILEPSCQQLNVQADENVYKADFGYL